MEACGKWGIAIREDKLRLWCTPTEEGMRIGGHIMHPTASMELLGAILGGGRNTAITHHISEAWTQLRSLKQVSCSRTLNSKIKLQRVHTEVVPELLWG